MNGRVYDPVVGRFMNAGPQIQDPLNLQSYNHYAYVLNNPLMYTDPSEYSFWTKLRDYVIKPVVIAVVAYYIGVAVNTWAMRSAVNAAVGAMAITGSQFAAAQVTAGIIERAAAEFTSGLLMNGDDLNFAFKSAIAGDITGGLVKFSGEIYGTVGKIAGQNFSSGVNAMMNEADFATGFKNGLVGAIRSEAFNYMKVTFLQF